MSRENTLVILRKLIKSFNNVHILTQKLADSIDRTSLLNFNDIEEILEDVILSDNFYKASEMTETELSEVLPKIIEKLNEDAELQDELEREYKNSY